MITGEKIPAKDGITVPVYECVTPYHVGTLVAPTNKTFSFEGAGLSVSEHPDEWRMIAHLSGDVWLLDRPLNLLDYHALTVEQKHMVASYGECEGWVQVRTVYRVCWFDDEWDQEMCFQFTDAEEAEAEAENYGVDVEVDVAWVATSSFPDVTVKAGDNGENVVEKLAVLWVAATQPHLDGVWWGDVLDVSRLSAPRGVVHLGHVPSLLHHFVKVS